MRYAGLKANRGLDIQFIKMKHKDDHRRCRLRGRISEVD